MDLLRTWEFTKNKTKELDLINRNWRIWPIKSGMSATRNLWIPVATRRTWGQSISTWDLPSKNSVVRMIFLELLMVVGSLCSSSFFADHLVGACIKSSCVTLQYPPSPTAKWHCRKLKITRCDYRIITLASFLFLPNMICVITCVREGLWCRFSHPQCFCMLLP